MAFMPYVTSVTVNFYKCSQPRRSFSEWRMLNKQSLIVVAKLQIWDGLTRCDQPPPATLERPACGAARDGAGAAGLACGRRRTAPAPPPTTAECRSAGVPLPPAPVPPRRAPLPLPLSRPTGLSHRPTNASASWY